MKIKIISKGNFNNFIKQGIDYYIKMIKIWKVETIFLKRAIRKKIMFNEINKYLKKDNFFILLDERGEEFTTSRLLKLINSVETRYKNIIIVIGGAEGVEEKIKKHIDKKIKLSSMLFNHELIFLMLSEQLYRIYCLKKGYQYSKK